MLEVALSKDLGIVLVLCIIQDNLPSLDILNSHPLIFTLKTNFHLLIYSVVVNFHFHLQHGGLGR